MRQFVWPDRNGKYTSTLLTGQKNGSQTSKQRRKTNGHFASLRIQNSSRTKINPDKNNGLDRVNYTIFETVRAQDKTSQTNLIRRAQIYLNKSTHNASR